MKLFNKISEEWRLFAAHTDNALPAGFGDRNSSILIVLGVLIISYLQGKTFPIMFSAIWIGIPTLLLLFKLLRIRTSKNFRRVLIAIVIFQALGVLINKGNIMEHIGSKYIQGFSTHEGVRYNDWTESEVHYDYYTSDTIYGKILIIVIPRLIFLLALTLPYITWRIGR
jgi:hypothetical protein